MKNQAEPPGFLLVFLTLFAALSAFFLPHCFEVGLVFSSATALVVYVLIAGLSFGLALLAYYIRFFYLLVLFGISALYVDLYFINGSAEGYFFEVLYLLLLGLIFLLLWYGLKKEPKKTSQFVAIWGLVFCVTSIGVPSTVLREQALIGDLELVETAGGNPAVVHIILDEQTSFSEMTKYVSDGRGVDRLLTAYRDRGFQLYDNVYSETTASLTSITHMLNGEYENSLLVPDKGASHALVDNNHFAAFAEKGYAIDVIQSNYLDLCVDIRLGRCRSYPRAASLGSLESLDISIANKLYLLVQALRLAYRDVTQPRGLYSYYVIQDYDFLVFGWPAHYSRPAAMLEVLEVINTEVDTWAGDTLYFSHILLPHFPFVLAPDCHYNGRDNMLMPAWEGAAKDSEAFLQSYDAYWQQAQCTHSRVLALVDRLLERPAMKDAMILIHGDHGYRVWLNAGKHGEASDDTERSAHKVFFAVRGVPVMEAKEKTGLSGMVTNVRQAFFDERVGH